MNNNDRPRRWLLVVLILIGLVISVILINKIVTDKKENRNSLFNRFNTINVKSYNSQFERYKGTQSGFFLTSLLDEIITNNKTNSHLITYKYEEISTTDANQIKDLKKNVDSSSTYEVTFDYDDKGYINSVTVEFIKKQSSDNVSPSFFNAFFSDDTKIGKSVMNLIDHITDSNKKYEDHKITLIYGSVITSDADELRNLKSSFDNWDDYNVWSDLDEDGYVYQIHIEKFN